MSELLNFQSIDDFSFAFVRHGATDFNLRGLRCGGDLDLPLAETAYQPILELGCWLRSQKIHFGKILCGNLLRVRQTALLLSGVLDALPVLSIADLDERHLGDWNGRPIAETEALLQAQQTPAGGESEAEFALRIRRALSEIYRQRNQRPLVISSQGVARVFYGMLGGAGRLRLGNGEWVEFARTTHAETQNVSLQLRRRLPATAHASAGSGDGAS
ncbi:MAG: histidine phosphatase family protein [Pseudomonadota bacterium]